jgi:hypothetical protein
MVQQRADKLSSINITLKNFITVLASTCSASPRGQRCRLHSFAACTSSYNHRESRGCFLTSEVMPWMLHDAMPHAMAARRRPLLCCQSFTNPALSSLPSATPAATTESSLPTPPSARSTLAPHAAPPCKWLRLSAHSGSLR